MNLQEQLFEEARKLYPGKKKGFEREYKNFAKRSKHPIPDSVKFDCKQVTPLLVPAIQYLIQYHAWCKSKSKWCPEYCAFTVWINQGRWEEVYPDFTPDSEPAAPTEAERKAFSDIRKRLRKS